MNFSALSLEERKDGVAVVWIDVPGESQNTLQENFRTEFEEIRKIIDQKRLEAVVIASKKDSSFIAGADIRLIRTLKSAAIAEQRSKEMQDALDAIENWDRPVVAAIHGACLGGGLELALACHLRVASDDPRTKLGLPEVQLGLLPGGGGTQRLPATVGVEAALDLMLTGKQIAANRALKIGLVSEVVPRSILVDVAAKRAKGLIEHQSKRPSFGERFSELTGSRALKDFALSKTPARRVVFDQAEKQVRKKAGDHYPAPFRILEVVEHGLSKGRKAGLELESKRFGELVDTDVSRALISIFFATQDLKKDYGTRNPEVRPKDVRKIGVLGGGLMGRGIAYVSLLDSEIDVRIKETHPARGGQALSEIRKLFDHKVSRKRLSERKRDRAMSRVTTTTDYSGFKNCDVVIEAVFEDLALKHRVLSEVETHAGPETIFASNTSSIPITEIADGASRPEMVIGMHYFSPVDKMPLLEVIRTEKTRDEVIATAVELGRNQGKTVIVVNDGVGFYTSRILAPYMNEASWMLAEAVPIEDIDRASKDAGFPVGPITLLDEVGLDTAEKVARIMHRAFGKRLTPPEGLEKLIADGRTGRKGQKGFYVYGEKDKRVDPTVYAILGVTPKAFGRSNLEELGSRLLVQMITEAIRCLEEGVLRSPRDGDIGAIFGLGFPPFLGGPFRYTDRIGPAELLKRVRQFADRYGPRFSAPNRLEEMARRGDRFYKE